MKHIIVADGRTGFLQNLNTYVLIEEKRLTVTVTLSIEQAAAALLQAPGSIVALGENILEEAMPGVVEQIQQNSSQVYGYCQTANGRYLFSEKGIPCIGLVQDAKKLVDILEAEKVPVMDTLQSPQLTIPQPQGLQASATVQEFQFVSPKVDRFTMVDDLEKRGSVESGYSPGMAAPPQINRQVPQNRMKTDPGGVTHQREQVESYVRDNGLIETEGVFQTSPRPARAKVVTIYAAKGGVGKTTVASETAVCLALTNNGRRRFRVCLVDYNIDFGDVATTLNMDSKGANMSDWCNDIRIQIDAGMPADDIWFSQEDMSDNYLQYMSKNGLYVLPAPVAHEDSMDIGEAELTVMLRNLAENGGFDYIIIDTGNNTRDSAVIALEAADFVLMIATQDVTTANCNDSFITTITKIGFDVGKIRLVINNAMPTQATGISVREVEENFPYPCAARIKRDDAVIKANNYGEPLVYNPRHEFTKQIMNIVQFITDNRIAPEMEEMPQKAGLFRRHFRKKGVR